MSSFKIQAEHKATGDTVNVFCMDDYFGKHKYGYIIDGEALTENEFYNQYEPVK